MGKLIENELSNLEHLCREWEMIENAYRLMEKYERYIKDVRSVINCAKSGNKEMTIDNPKAEIIVAKLFYVSRKALENIYITEALNSCKLDSKEYFFTEDDIDYVLNNIQTRGHLFETSLDQKPEKKIEVDVVGELTTIQNRQIKNYNENIYPIEIRKYEEDVDIKNCDIDLVEFVLNKKQKIDDEVYHAIWNNQNVVAEKIGSSFPYIEIINHKEKHQGRAYYCEEVFDGVSWLVKSGEYGTIEDAYIEFVRIHDLKTKMFVKDLEDKKNKLLYM